MAKICLIGFAGALGTVARYMMSGWVAGLFGASFPFGTLAVNVLGSFLIGLVMPIGLESSLLSPTLRVVMTAGFLGGFTTYSSFNYETLAYFQGEVLKAIFNTAGMLLTCWAAGVVGIWLSRWFIGGFS